MEFQANPGAGSGSFCDASAGLLPPACRDLPQRARCLGHCLIAADAEVGQKLRVKRHQRLTLRPGFRAKAGIRREIAVESDDSRTVEASVSADLAVQAVLAGSEPPDVERIVHGGTLPDLARTKVDLDRSDTGNNPSLEAICALIRRASLQRLGGRAVVL